MSSRRMRVGIGLVTGVVLTLGSVLGGGAAAGGPPTGTTVGVAGLRVPGACPSTRAIGAIRPGMTGIGWTTVRDDRPLPFRVRVLGTLRDGIAPGRDLVVVKVSDLAGQHVIRAGGGIWSGMSGSPVYIRGRLAGAISYSLADGPSPVGGMTPARYMERLADEPVRSSAARRADVSGPTSPGRPVVRLTGRLDRAVTAEAGRAAGRTTVLRRLGVPVAASAGVGTRRSFVTRELRRQLGSVRLAATGASSGAAVTTLAAPPRAGQNLAVVISQGDVTIAAVGTVTAVCHRRIIGFGHPMSSEGSVAYGAARARTVAIVGGRDPYKLANIGRLFGTLDVDRSAGVRAVGGIAPRMTPITAQVRSRTTGRTRIGRTRVAMPAWMPTVAADHLLYDIQVVEDRLGGGTAQLEWTIRGTRLDTGTSWTLRRSERVSDPSDVAYASALLLFEQLDTLTSDPNAEVRLASVRVTATVTRGATVDRVRRVEVSRNSGPWMTSGTIAVDPGDQLRVRVSLRPRTGRTYSRTVDLVVPSGASGSGVLRVIGGASVTTTGCDPIGDACPATFGQLLDGLRAAPRGDDLLVGLDLAAAGLHVTGSTRLDHVVEGVRELGVEAD